ncbi:hypothetical protein B0H34DRAFT_719382 [Crassisporium funariophilum]|nr:hypothetical protein B0H34DRAFT_719382 [Crassisporium funariophilum]
MIIDKAWIKPRGEQKQIHEQKRVQRTELYVTFAQSRQPGILLSRKRQVSSGWDGTKQPGETRMTSEYENNPERYGVTINPEVRNPLVMGCETATPTALPPSQVQSDPKSKVLL